MKLRNRAQLCAAATTAVVLTLVISGCTANTAAPPTKESTSNGAAAVSATPTSAPTPTQAQGLISGTATVTIDQPADYKGYTGVLTYNLPAIDLATAPDTALGKTDIYAGPNAGLQLQFSNTTPGGRKSPINEGNFRFLAFYTNAEICALGGQGNSGIVGATSNQADGCLFNVGSWPPDPSKEIGQKLVVTDQQVASVSKELQSPASVFVSYTTADSLSPISLANVLCNISLGVQGISVVAWSTPISPPVCSKN